MEIINPSSLLWVKTKKRKIKSNEKVNKWIDADQSVSWFFSVAFCLVQCLLGSKLISDVQNMCKSVTYTNYVEVDALSHEIITASHVMSVELAALIVSHMV